MSSPFLKDFSCIHRVCGQVVSDGRTHSVILFNIVFHTVDICLPNEPSYYANQHRKCPHTTSSRSWWYSHWRWWCRSGLRRSRCTGWRSSRSSRRPGCRRHPGDAWWLRFAHPVAPL